MADQHREGGAARRYGLAQVGDGGVLDAGIDDLGEEGTAARRRAPGYQAADRAPEQGAQQQAPDARTDRTAAGGDVFGFGYVGMALLVAADKDGVVQLDLTGLLQADDREQ